jgi:hypothetical protein
VEKYRNPRATEGESIYLPWLAVHFKVCQNLYVYFFLVNTVMAQYWQKFEVLDMKDVVCILKSIISVI